MYHSTIKLNFKGIPPKTPKKLFKKNVMHKVGIVQTDMTFKNISSLETLNKACSTQLLNAQKEKVENEYNEIKKEKESLEKSIEQLKKNYEESVVESNTIKKDMEEVKSKVERSEKLLSNLTSEKDRWSDQMTDFKAQFNNLLGDTFLSSSFLAYMVFMMLFIENI